MNHKITMRIPQTLVPYERNSRTHSPEQVGEIARSIAEYGFTNPVLLTKDSMIIAGHGRVLAAEMLGLNEIPCIELAHLSDTQVRTLVIADNKIALNAGWDDEMLTLELQDLSALDVDLGGLGFSEEELNGLIGQQCESDSQSQDEEDVAPITKPGDIWVIGQHRIICGKGKSAVDVSGLFAVDAAVKSWTFATKEDAVLGSTGETFAEVSERIENG